MRTHWRESSNTDKKRSEVAWPEIPEDFDEWTPPKKRRTRKNDGTEIMLFSWRRYVYKFVIYITLCKSRGDFDITHVFSLTAKKVVFVTFLCISCHEDMCSEVLLAKQRYCNTHAFLHDFWCVYNMTFVFSFVHSKCVMFETVLYT